MQICRRPFDGVDMNMKDILYKAAALCLLPVAFPVLVASHMRKSSRYNMLPICKSCGWKHDPVKHSCIPADPPKYNDVDPSSEG